MNKDERFRQEQILQQIEAYRTMLHAEIDEIFTKLSQTLKTGSRGETFYELPLTTTSSNFKGLKPSAIIYKDGEKVKVRTWREVAEQLLKRCDATKHEELVKISEDMQGRTRSIMSTKASGLQKPMEVGVGIYMESYYDTETFMRIVTKRIFDKIGYDYTGIKIRVG